MDVSVKMLCQANRKDNGQLVVGYYFCMHHNDDRKHIHHFVIPLEADLSIGTPIEKIQVEIDPNTVHIRCFDYLRQSKDFETQSKDDPILLENQHKPYGISTNANSPWISRCPRCGKKVEGKQTRFCKYCGQAVKWE